MEKYNNSVLQLSAAAFPTYVHIHALKYTHTTHIAYVIHLQTPHMHAGTETEAVREKEREREREREQARGHICIAGTHGGLGFSTKFLLDTGTV